MDEIERALRRMELEVERNPERYTEPKPASIEAGSRDRDDGWVEVRSSGPCAYKFAPAASSTTYTRAPAANSTTFSVQWHSSL